MIIVNICIQQAAIENNWEHDHQNIDLSNEYWYNVYHMHVYCGGREVWAGERQGVQNYFSSLTFFGKNLKKNGIINKEGKTDIV